MCTWKRAAMEKKTFSKGHRIYIYIYIIHTHTHHVHTHKYTSIHTAHRATKHQRRFLHANIQTLTHKKHIHIYSAPCYKASTAFSSRENSQQSWAQAVPGKQPCWMPWREKLLAGDYQGIFLWMGRLWIQIWWGSFRCLCFRMMWFWRLWLLERRSGCRLSLGYPRRWVYIRICERERDTQSVNAHTNIKAVRMSAKLRLPTSVCIYIHSCMFVRYTCFIHA